MSAEVDTRALEVLAQVIEARKQYISTETTENAVTATCINLLTSLRADTATVKKRPSIFDGRYYVEIEDTGLVGGWAHPPRIGRKGRRVVRPAGGGKAIDRYNGMRIVNLAGNYARCHESKVYQLAIYNVYRIDGSGKPFYPARVDSCYVMAANEDDVRKFAEQRIKRRIGQYRGISKRALGAAMHAFGKGGTVGGDLQRLVDAVVDVKQVLDGYGDGHFGVSVEDNLPMAQKALKSGSMTQSIQKACNRTVSIINRFGDKAGRMWERLETPFPEAVGGASRVRGARAMSGLYLSSRDTLVTMRI